jgi:hypothetical protein
MVQMARAIGGRAEENFPSKAYGPYLEARGLSPFLATGVGSLTISLGTRQANEAKRVARVVEAIRFLARGDRQKRAILPRAKLVLTASKETSIVDGLFHDAGLHEGEFLGLLQTVIDGGAINRERITTIAARSRPRCLAPKDERSAPRRRRTSCSLRRMRPSGYRPGSLRAMSKVNVWTSGPKPLGRNLTIHGLTPAPPVGRVKLRGAVKTNSSPSTIR